MSAHFDHKEVDGYSSVFQSVQPSASSTMLRSALAALMISGCNPSIVQQEAMEPRLITSVASKVANNTGVPGPNHNQPVKNSTLHQAPKNESKTKENFDAVCQATGAFNITPENDLLMEIRCVKDTIGFAGFRAEDMQLDSASKQHPDIHLTPFVNESHISIAKARNEITVTLSFQDKEGTSHNITLPKLKGGLYEYSFADYVPDNMIPENDFRTFER